MNNSNNKLLTNKAFVAVMAMLCCGLWGSASPFIKIGSELMIPPKHVPSTILFAGIRFFFAGVITILIYSIARRKFLLPKKENVFSVAKVSLFQTILQYLFFYIGLSNTTSVKGAVISGSNCFFSILCATLLFRQEKLTVKKSIACLIGFAGVVLINLNGISFDFNFFGDGFVLISNLAYGISGTLMKRYSSKEDPVVISGYQFIMGGFVMILVGLISGGVIEINSFKAAGIMLYLALLSAVAYSVWGVLLKHNSVSSVSIYTFMTPVFGVLLSNLMLTEQSKVSPLFLAIALLLVCIGIFTLNYQRKKKNQ